MQPSRGSDRNLSCVFSLSENHFDSENYFFCEIKHAAKHARQSDFLPQSKWCKSVSWTELWASGHSRAPGRVSLPAMGQGDVDGSRCCFNTAHSKLQMCSGSRIKLVIEMYVMWFSFGGKDGGHHLDVYLVVWARTRGIPELLTLVTWEWRAVDNNHIFILNLWIILFETIRMCNFCNS